MNIAIIGYGKMGKMIEQAASARGHTIAAIVDPKATGSSFLTRVKISKTIAEEEHFDIVDAAIEFTQPDTAVPNVIELAKRKIPTVTGTTGWQNQMDEVRQTVLAAGGTLIWASNFSIGVNLFYNIAWYAAELINKFPEYDAGGFESHHNKKIDSPSGTAKVLAEGLLSRLDRKNKIVWDIIDRRPEPDELHFPSLRMGSIIGEHSALFDSAADTIEITHTARNREGFASGAVRAAEWLASPGADGKKRQGIFSIDEMLKDIFGEDL
jgi:4-hydroxy-tetrahydrodipicolinate reductase